TITSGAAASENENTASANVVYTIAATDPDTVGTRSYAISGDDAGQFTVDAGTGEVRFAASPDFEAPADLNHDNVYDIVVHASDGVHDVTRPVAITVSNVNDAPHVTVPAQEAAVLDAPSHMTGISFTDADANGAAETATFHVSSGTLTASNGGGVTVTGSTT